MTPPPLLSRALTLTLAAAAASFAGLGLLLSTVPAYAATLGAGGAGAGLCTGALMFASVVTEPAVPALLRRFGNLPPLFAGVLMLGAPALLLAARPGLALTLVVCLVRGSGLALIVVVGTALVAEVSPPERRNEGLGLYGLAIGVPPILTIPGGIWLAGHVGYSPIFVAGALLPLLALFFLPGLPRRPGFAPATAAKEGGNGGMAGPALTFAAVTFAYGVVITFVPLAVRSDSSAVALFAMSCTAPLARWASGHIGDRRGPGPLVPLAVLMAVAGMAGLIWTGDPLALVAGAAVFGLGFGTAQNVTLAVMLERVPAIRYGAVSALWNIAYDAGMGIGAIGFGFAVDRIGYRTGFALTTAVLGTPLLVLAARAAVAQAGKIRSR
jgi:MFS family permease